MININKKEDVFRLILKEYNKRNSLIKSRPDEKELAENKRNIDNLMDRYFEE